MSKPQDYKSGDQISRAQAWRDFKWNFTRAKEWRERPWHVYKAVCVDIARLAGVSDRDRSQNVGMVIAIAFPVAIIAIVWSLL